MNHSNKQPTYSSVAPLLPTIERIELVKAKVAAELEQARKAAPVQRTINDVWASWMLK